MSEGRIQIVDVRTQSSALLEALRQRSLTDLPAEVEETVVAEADLRIVLAASGVSGVGIAGAVTGSPTTPTPTPPTAPAVLNLAPPAPPA